MASASSTSDDLYDTAIDLATCTICLEPMKTPKHLQCFHTFCQTCISAYCKSQCFGEQKEKTTLILTCPVCRLEIIVDENATEKTFSADVWAEKLPSNFFIVELLERAKIENRIKICVSCERLGEKNEAIYYCIECGELYCKLCCKYHKSQKLSITHTIKEVTEVSTKDMKSSQHFCPMHQGEVLKLYCSDHDIECCSICVSVGHRKCETVKTLEHAAKDIRDSEMLTTVRGDLQTYLKELTNIKDSYLQEGKAFQEKIWSEIKAINLTRDGIKKKLDDISDELIVNLTHKSENSDSKYRKIVDEITCRIDMISNELKTLNVALDKSSNVQVMVTLKELLKQSSNHKESVTHHHKEYVHAHFSSNIMKEKQNILSSLEKMYVSSIFEKCDYPLTCNTLTPIKLVEMFEIKLDDKNNEACFRSNNTICVANFNLSCLEIYNLKGEKTSTVQLDYVPYSVATDGQGYLAVLNTNGKMVEIFNDDMEVERTYKIGHGCCNGIALSADYIVISTDSSRVMCFEREKGTIVKQLKELSDVSWYMCFDEKGFYYSSNDIIYFQDILMDESTVFTTEDFEQTQGVVINKQKNMFVADQDKNSLFQISSDRTSSCVLLSDDNGIDRPHGIDLSDDQDYFLVTNNLGRAVLVYKVEPIVASEEATKCDAEEQEVTGGGAEEQTELQI